MRACWEAGSGVAPEAFRVFTQHWFARIWRGTGDLKGAKYHVHTRVRLGWTTGVETSGLFVFLIMASMNENNLQSLSLLTLDCRV